MFLILLKLVFVAIPKSDRKASATAPTAAEQKTNFLPSILGGIFLLAGTALLLKTKVDPIAAEAHRP